MVPLPIVTAENNRILILRLIDFNSDNLVFDDALSVWSMVYDTSMITPDTGSYADGEVIIFDVKGLSAKHLTRFGLSSLKCYLKYMISAHPIRIKQIHVLNSHAILDKLMIILRPFLGAKAMKVIHFHVPNSSTLYDFVPRDVLPDELGGTIGTITTPKWYWIHRTEDHR